MTTFHPLGFALLVTLAMTVVPSTVHAQPATAPTADAPLDTTAVDEALDLYWGQQRKITPLERRNHDHAWRHEFTLYGGIVPNERFFSFYPLGARYDLFFHNDFAAELWGAYLIGTPSALNEFYNDNATLGETALGTLPPELTFMGGASLIWSPIHGKFALFSSKLTHFDVYLATGLTILGTTSEERCTNPNDADTCSGGDAITAGGHIGFGFRVQFLEWMAAKIEYRQHFYGATEGATTAPAEFNFGISFWTPGGEE